MPFIISSTVRIVLKILVAFVNAIVSQMHESALFWPIGRVCFTGESNQSFVIHIDPKWLE
jgi:hypothetical protein